MRSPAYQRAIIAVYDHQPQAQKAAILKGALTNSTPEGNWVLAHAFNPFSQAVHVPKSSSGDGFLGLGAISNAVTGAVPAIAGVSGDVANFARKALSNAGSDFVNLPGNTVQGIYGLGKNLAEGHLGNAFHMLVDPYVNLAQHPGSFFDHPINNALLFAGPEAGLGHIAGAVARSGAVGEHLAAAASTARAPLALGKIGDVANPAVEARSYSGSVLHKPLQVAWEKHLQARGLDPNIARPAPKVLPASVAGAMNVGVHAKLNRVADEMVAVRQMAGRDARGQATAALNKAAPPKVVRDISTHILQGVIRTPETATHDMHAEIGRLTANMTGSRSIKTIQARRQIQSLTEAAKHPQLVQDLFHQLEPVRAGLHGADKILVGKGLLDPEQAMRSKLFPYAIAHMNATYDHTAGHLVNPAHPDGLPTQAILDHLKANKVPDPAYVGHYPGKASSYQFYQRYRLARGTAGGHARTGEAFRTGNYDHTYNGLVAQAARTAETVTKAQLHDKLISRFGILKPTLDEHGKQIGSEPFRNPNEAAKYARAAQFDDHGNPIPGRLEMTPISLAPKGTLDLTSPLQRPNALQHEPGMELNAIKQALDEAKRPGANNIGLVPKIVADRMMEQFKTTGSRTLGKVTQQFRRTVLPYSTHWMMQIGSEAVVRGLVAGVLDPRNVAAGRQLMHHLSTTPEGRAALQEMVNATFYGSDKNLSIHNPNANPVVAAAKTMPITRQIISAHNHYADGVQAAMYHLEHEFRVMGLGKLARKQVQEFTGSYQGGIKLQAHNLDMLATKLKTDPALVARFGRQIDDTFGKYNKLSPKVRAMVQTATPFLPWYLNAAKFVLWTLPAKHPVASSLLASLRQTINQDVADGKQKPLNDFALQQLARITPFGIFNPPKYKGAGGAALDLGQTALSTVLPQALGPVYNMAGVNSFGEGPLKGPHGYVKAGSPQAGASAVESMIEALLPGTSKVREALAGGRPTYGTSTLLSPQPKPGNPGGDIGTILDRLFNPAYGIRRAINSPASPGGNFLMGGSAAGSGPLMGNSSSSGGYLMP